MERSLLPGQLYRHFKNKLYQVIAIAKHSETGEEMVVYQALYGTYEHYVRPRSMFMSEVDLNKYPEVKQKYRFELVERETLEAKKSNHKEDCINSKVDEPYIEDKDADIKNNIHPDLYAFLDATSYDEKLQILLESKKKNRLDMGVLHTMAISLDFPIDNLALEEQFQAVVYYLETHKKYEGSRLR